MKPKKTSSFIILFFVAQSITLPSLCQSRLNFNRAPLKQDVYIQLPLGSIKAKGWLLKQLELQKSGATGHAEELYPGKDDLGPDADWLGGTGNSWEKAPYYLKGLVALAYTLDDAELKAKAQKWIDYTLNHQQENGLFGSPKMKDWWPRMPFMYALQSYYEATNDARVIPFLSKYLKYELANLDADPLRDWGKARAGDNMEIALWLYNKTGDAYLVDLVKKLQSQAYPWADIHNNNEFFYFGRDFHPRHMVSVAQALKFPVVYSQIDTSPYYANAMQNGINNIMRDHGLPQGLSSGTEFLAGRSSVQGVETCTVVEWMQSLETAFRITPDASLGDQLEKIAFNALPAQFSKDFKNHTYYTLPNQVQALPGPHGFNQDYANGIVPSPYSGYPCCRYNMHMGWPYFVKNSWSATPDGGLAVSIYAPMEVTAPVQNTRIKIQEDTNYPFEEQIRLKLTLQQPALFPLHLRIPGWCTKPQVLVNGKEIAGVKPGQMLVVNRKWNSNDKIVLNFPMHLAVKPQVNNAVSIERGPLVYALKIQESVKNVKEFPVKGFFETEISPASAWNYGLLLDKTSLEKNIIVVKGPMPENPFVQNVTPVILKLKAKRIPSWTIDDNKIAALDVPFSPVASAEKTEEVTLVPFGSENLRVTIFPTIGKPQYITSSYKETFDNNSMPQSLVFYGGGWFCKDKAIHTAANEDGKSGRGTKVIATGTRFSNLTYTADVSVNSTGDAGLVFRVTEAAIGSDAYKGYYVGLNAETGTIQFGKASNSKWVVISSAKYPLEMNKSYKVTIKAVNDKFDVFINDEKKAVISAKDSEYKTGSIGLRAYNALASADNISVTAL
ncbi:DUF1080 domain-containing protein [Mucilaginibacter limnophilus]|uniref:DUF1080 domain-containing protein n=1 Tax=Mucilaginibacter limnophilus TaxID=1932778 RepID=A0A3S2UKE3_9SPHI|nr:beta-L-arabinofuranosidase domain-containing protein [Mucilaginibacter limnophilus]RVU00308.1 DUF1080 domain-containing protein [Mucilaginibacter limnophilus]